MRRRHLQDARRVGESPVAGIVGHDALDELDLLRLLAVLDDGVALILRVGEVVSAVKLLAAAVDETDAGDALEGLRIEVVPDHTRNASLAHRRRVANL